MPNPNTSDKNVSDKNVSDKNVLDTNKRFEVSIPFKVEEIVNGESTPFFDCDLVYHDMPYDGVVAIQYAMIELLKGLNQMGVEVANEMGLGANLEKLMGKK